ncbi:PepSY domain-containing protein [Novosphingobium umbonatum]|uniref:PepSY domain-containing protein n=1 Tax=Novosphingobium umbonatum TaxID=1908524 RepID=A0A437N799_9SPHN|nr:PepSY-associated TM helix domain-containing protein [Novosphingobium umbonatum]RVU05816.1 PepSY domain-containing protein [Novosphingobium umbonatum]
MAGQRLRHWVRQVHLWMGLSLGLLFVLLGLTGSALVFYQSIDRWLHPEIQVASSGPAPDAQSPVWDRGLETLRTQWPERQGVWRFELTGEAGAIPVRYEAGGQTQGHSMAHRVMVWLSPDGRHVLRQEVWGGYLVTWLYDLHMELLGGDTGRAFVGWGGLAIFLLVMVTGLWAWWPKGGWGKALRYAHGAALIRRLRDMHKLAGLLGLPLLAILVLTGVMLALPEESNAVLRPMFGPVDPAPKVAIPANTAPRLTIMQAAALAQKALPSARIVWIDAPAMGQGVYKFRMKVPADPSARFPHSFVFIDPVSGRIVGLQDAQQAGATTTINNWLHSLHDASVLGLFTRWLAVVSGLVPAFLFVTGLWRWLARRQQKSKAEAPVPRHGAPRGSAP